MEEFDADVFGVRGGVNPPLATHCDIPLKYNKQRAAIQKPSTGQKISKYNQYKRELDQIFVSSGQMHIHYYDLAHAQDFLLNKIKIEDKNLNTTEFKQQIRCANELWRINHSGLKQTSNIQLSQENFNFTIEELDYLAQQYKIRSFWEELSLSTGSKTFKPGIWFTKNQDGLTSYEHKNVKIYALENLALISIPNGNYLVSRDHLLILSDLASQRYLLRFLSTLEDKMPVSDFLPLEFLNKLLKNGDDILATSGNSGYKFIYMLEPLCVSMLVGDIPPDHANGDTFYNKVTAEALKLAESMEILDLHIERMVLLHQIKKNPTHISQAFGLYRIWGHPTLEPLEGTSALKKIATVVRGFDSELAEQITNKFKEEFIIRYIKRENKWPELNVEELSPSNPLKIAYLQKSLYPKHHVNYKRDSLSLVTFKQLFPVDPKFDLVEMIADKAMSLFTPELIHNLLTNKGVGTAIDRSVLVQWLSSSLHDPKEFLMNIDKYGFSSLERSVAVREKEREGKIEARLFGLMTLIKRMYIVLTEALLAEHILVYFPEITMIDDELSLDKKRLQFNSPTLMKRALFTSLDFSKWNSNMREAETKDLFKCFDDMFGFSNCFQRTHEMFKTSFIYLLNGSYVPTYKHGQFQTDLGSWTGHLGGIEGLRQKGWTLWTVALILLAAENFPIILRLMGQGDNQILREIYPEEISSLRQLEIHYEFIQTLNQILARIGPPLKLEETWTSRDLYIYGKYLIYKGAPLAMYGKRICRMFRMSNEDFPTLESTISSLTANLSAAIGSSYQPGVLLYLYYIELIGTLQMFFRSSYLQKDPPYRMLSKPSLIRIPHEAGTFSISTKSLLNYSLIQRDSIYLKLCLFPRAFGGLPITNIFSIIIRGFPDEVSFAASSIKLFYPHVNPELQLFFRNILSPELCPTTNYTLLFEHPTSLNLLVPPAPSEARRNAVIRFLQNTSRVKNPFLKAFLDLIQSPHEKMMLNYLATATPFNPRVLSIISGSTVEARARHIANKLQKTKTISILARQEGEEDLFLLISDSELNHITNVLHMCSKGQKGPIIWNSTVCSVEHVSKLRDYGWKRQIEGVDCVPPQEFLYLENIPLTQSCYEYFESSKGYVSIRFGSSAEHIESKNPLILGAYPPYRGSVTRQKSTGYGETLALQADPLLQKILRAFNLIGWGIKPNGNLASLLKTLLIARTDLNPSCLIPDEVRLTGSVHHRLQDSRTGHGGAVSILPNFGSHFGFDTFPLTEYSKGSKNVNLMFQSLMSYGTVYISWALANGWKPLRSTVHIHVKSSCCVKEINDNLIECDQIPPPCVMKYEDSPYLYIKSESFMSGNLCFPGFSADAPLTDDPYDLSCRLMNLMSDEIISILSPHSWDISETIGTNFALVINWCLKLPLLKTLELVVLRLVAHYIPTIRKSSISEFLFRVASRIDRSPIQKWAQLSNLIFCPNFAQDLMSPPYQPLLTGNPCLDPDLCGLNLKESCRHICLTWASTPYARDRLHDLNIYSSSTCGVNQHPAVLLLIKDFILGLLNAPVIDIKYLITSSLTLESPIPHDHILTPIANYYLAKSKLKILRENLDYIAKKAPEPIREKGISPSSTFSLPSTCITFIIFGEKNLEKSEMTVSIGDTFSRTLYETHHLRPIVSPTSGQYKGLSLIYSLNLFEGNVMCLGDGSGGYTWSFLRSNPSCTVFYNSLIDNIRHIEQAPPIPYIPALAGWEGFEERINQLDLTNNGISDITHPDYPLFLKKHLTHQYNLLICDAETPNYLEGSTGVSLASAISLIAYTLKVEKIVFKTYCLNPSLLRAQISIFLSHYSEVHIVRSDFSSFRNSEVFLYCKHRVHQKVLKINHKTLTGWILRSSHLDAIISIRDCCLNGATSLNQETSNLYTSYLCSERTDLIRSRLIDSIPILATDESLTYPHSVTKWIQDTCQKTRGHPRAYRIKLETHYLSDYLLSRWSVAWLVLGVWSSALKIQDVEDIVKDCVLLWYSLLDDTWEISLCDKTPPEEIQGIELLCWPLTDLLTSRHVKLIFHLCGLCQLYNKKPNAYSNSINRGNLTIRGKPVKGVKSPASKWIKDNVYLESKPIPGVSSTHTPQVSDIWEQRLKRRRRF